MKNFFRTLFGKTLLFLLCMAMTTVAVVSVFLITIMLHENFYTRTQEEIFEEYSQHIVISELREVLSEYREEISEYQRGKVPSSPIIVTGSKNLVYQIVDGNRVLMKTDNGRLNMKWEYNYPIFVHGDRLTYPVYSPKISNNSDKTGLMINALLMDDYSMGDRVSFLHSSLNFFYALRYWIYVIALFTAIAALSCFIMLLTVSARRKNSDDIHPGSLNFIPFDLMILGSLFTLLMSFVNFKYSLSSGGFEILVLVFIFGEILLALIIGLSMSAAARIKQGTLLKKSLLYMSLDFLWKSFLKAVRGLMKTIGSFAIMPRLMSIVVFFIIADFFLLHLIYNSGAYISDLYVYWFIKNLLLFLLTGFLIYSMDKLRKGAAKLAKGDVKQKISTDGLYFDFKDHAEDLNSIAQGIELAVDDAVKSERMKTELITNVSHDIKTPLTSIINYSTLISEGIVEDNYDTEKIREYSDVLIRQSGKLKKLIDDLVEASKASTGNLELSPVCSDAALYLTQITGEYADRLEKLGLTVISNLSFDENEVFIMADSRRMWRIFENVMNNICKYALSGTRVYLGLEVIDDRVVFSFKNTSREALNISPSELFERFTQGDRSRNTEGSGLGLSIAKSLTELQGGSMAIVIDGDLFKLTIAFPIVSKPEEI